MLDVFQGFVHELRAVGLPVSMTENLDAMRAVEHIDLADRAGVRTALAATLVKHQRHRPAFDTVFDVYFGTAPTLAGADMPGLVAPGDEAQAREGAGAGGEGLGRDELAEMLLAALIAMDEDALRRLVSLAVTQFAAMEPGRPVGGTYYMYRTVRQLDLGELTVRLLGGLSERQVTDDALGERLLREDVEARLALLRSMIEEEIRRRLVADRGREAMARTLRKPLPEDIEFMHASRDEIVALQRAIQPLTRSLAARLAQRRRRRHRGHLDFRRTVRASLSYGGVPAEPKFRHPHPSKPEIMIVADVSGSVASFARFTLQFVYAIGSQFSKVRSWAFVDGIDEVTRFFEEADDMAEAVRRVNTEANVLWVDGHSDYGHALTVFHQRHATEVTHKTSLILLGDARNNYHPSHAWALDALRRRAKHVYWLNPEPRSYWDSGDSIISEYGRYCDGVFECRNLRQLEGFVSAIADGR